MRGRKTLYRIIIGFCLIFALGLLSYGYAGVSPKFAHNLCRIGFPNVTLPPELGREVRNPSGEAWPKDCTIYGPLGIYAGFIASGDHGTTILPFQSWDELACFPPERMVHGANLEFQQLPDQGVLNRAIEKGGFIKFEGWRTALPGQFGVEKSVDQYVIKRFLYLGQATWPTKAQWQAMKQKCAQEPKIL